MKIHEYQAKELLAAAGAAVPRGVVVSTPAEAQQAFDQLGGARLCSRPRSTPAAAARARSRAAARTTAASNSSNPATRPARSRR